MPLGLLALCAAIFTIFGVSPDDVDNPSIRSLRSREALCVAVLS